MSILWSWAFRLLGAAAVVGGIWYGVDSVVSVFRANKELRYDIEREKADKAKAEFDRDAARLTQMAVTALAAADRAARDKASSDDVKRAAKIQKELDRANDNLAKWKSGASPELAACLRLPLPRWLLYGEDEAPPAPGAAELGPVVQGHAQPAGRPAHDGAGTAAAER